MNKRDLLALNLVGPTVTRPVVDPLDVLRLYNRLYSFANFSLDLLTLFYPDADSVLLNLYLVTRTSTSYLYNCFFKF